MSCNFGIWNRRRATVFEISQQPTDTHHRLGKRKRDDHEALHVRSTIKDDAVIAADIPALSINEYRHATISSEEVRLMVLYPGRFDDSVSCGLNIVPMNCLDSSQFVYQALSYAWGPKIDLQAIWITDIPAYGKITSAAVFRQSNANVDSQKFYVRPNLFAALRSLRSESEEIWVWIDAICIDQENPVEKGHQIPGMLDIFCNAWNVCIWLGEAEPSNDFISCEPFNLVKMLTKLELLEDITEASTVDEEMMLSLVAFAKLLKRPWFRRRWVIQEVSLSTRASVQYGQNNVNWVDFADAVQLFVLKIDRIRALYRGSRLFKRDPEAFSHVEATGASAIVQATHDVLRKGDDGRIVARLCDIETLVMRFVYFEASDPRDTIFSLWSLASIWTTAHEHLPAASRQLAISPSTYMRPCESIYKDFVCHCIEQHGSLDIICRHWALPLDNHPEDGQPSRIRSWVGTTTNSAFGMRLGSGGRINGDSLVGEPGRKVYNACNDTPPWVCTLPSPAFDTMLRVSGRVISRVSQVSPRIVDGMISYDALRLLGWNSRTMVNAIPDRLWKTLVADRTRDGSRAPSWWRRASMFALSLASHNGDLNTQDLLQNKSLPLTVHEYLRRVQAIVWNRRIFALESYVHGGADDAYSLPEIAGLGPSDAHQGDLVCVLNGCSVVVLLREVSSAECDGVYELVGECYVHGMMDGEALLSVPPEACSSAIDFFNLV